MTALAPPVPLLDEAALVRRRVEATGAPLVTIIVRTYPGRAPLLRECLRSLTAQTYRPLEIVIVEDGGATAREVALGVARDPGLGVVHYAAPKQGRSSAGNLGLALSGGELLGFLDDDDLLLADHVEVLAAALGAHAAAPAAYARALEVETEFTAGTWLPYRELAVRDRMPASFSQQRLWVANFLPIQSVLFRRDVYLAEGGFCPELDALEDWDLWQRYALHGDFVHVARTTSRYRMPADLRYRPERALKLAEHYRAVRARQEQMGRPSVAERRRAAGLRDPLLTSEWGRAALRWLCDHPRVFAAARRIRTALDRQRDGSG